MTLKSYFKNALKNTKKFSNISLGTPINKNILKILLLSSPIYDLLPSAVLISGI